MTIMLFWSREAVYDVADIADYIELSFGSYRNRRWNQNNNLPRREDDESRPCYAENPPIFSDYGLKGANNEEVFAPKRVDRRL